MRQCTQIIILLIMLFGLFGCKKIATDYVFEQFKAQIEKQGMKIDSVDETGLIYVSQGDLTLKISLDNVRRNYERDKDKTHISDLVQTLASYSIGIPATWSEAKPDIYISLFPNENDFKDFLHQRITEDFGKVYIHDGHDKLTWITTEYLRKWNITEAELDRQANLNADKLLALTEITFDKIDNHKLGIIDVENETLKGALLFAPAMKEKVKQDFGFPFYSRNPC